MRAALPTVDQIAEVTLRSLFMADGWRSLQLVRVDIWRATQPSWPIIVDRGQVDEEAEGGSIDTWRNHDCTEDLQVYLLPICIRQLPTLASDQKTLQDIKLRMFRHQTRKSKAGDARGFAVGVGQLQIEKAERQLERRAVHGDRGL